jgi:hypothetical protein
MLLKDDKTQQDAYIALSEFLHFDLTALLLDLIDSCVGSSRPEWSTRQRLTLEILPTLQRAVAQGVSSQSFDQYSIRLVPATR